MWSKKPVYLDSQLIGSDSMLVSLQVLLLTDMWHISAAKWECSLECAKDRLSCSPGDNFHSLKLVSGYWAMIQFHHRTCPVDSQSKGLQDMPHVSGHFTFVNCISLLNSVFLNSDSLCHFDRWFRHKSSAWSFMNLFAHLLERMFELI